MSNSLAELPPLSDIEEVSSLKDSLPPIEQLDTISTYFSSPIFVASAFVFILFVLVFVFMNNLIKEGKEPIDILKAFGIPLIIASSALIVVTGLRMDTLTPVIGLLGTIAGYLLGQKDKTNK